MGGDDGNGVVTLVGVSSNHDRVSVVIVYAPNPNKTKKVEYNLAHKFDLNCYRNFGCVTSLLTD